MEMKLIVLMRIKGIHFDNIILVSSQICEAGLSYLPQLFCQFNVICW